jgi:hypothetical protein
VRSDRVVLLAAVLLVGVLLRVGAAWHFRTIPPSGDQVFYLHAAASLARGEGLDYKRRHWAGTQWPPGQAAFLALFAREGPLERPSRGPAAFLLEFQIPAARIATALLSLVGIALLVELGRRSFDLRTGLVAGALLAVYPNSVGMSHLFSAESNFTVALLIAMVLALHASDARGGEPRPLRFALAGVAFGGAAMFRSIALPLSLPFALRALFGPGSRRSRALACAALIAGVLLGVAPWTVRNALVYDRFLLLDTSAGESMWLGNNDFPPMNPDRKLFRLAEGGRPRCRLPNPVDNYNCEMRGGLAHIAAHPGVFASRVVTRFAALANPSSLIAKNAHFGYYGRGARATWVVALCAGGFTLLAAAAILGLAGARFTADRAALAASLGVALLVPATLLANTRYRLVAVPVAVLFAAHALVDARGVRARLAQPARVAAAALGFAWLAAGWIMYGWTLR